MDMIYKNNIKCFVIDLLYWNKSNYMGLKSI